MVKKLPPVSTLATVFGAAATAALLGNGAEAVETLTVATAMVSPFTSGGMAAMGAGSAFQAGRSKLARAFSTAAAVTGTLGLAGFAMAVKNPEIATPMMAILSTLAGTTVAGGLNVTSALTETTKTSVPPSDNKQKNAPSGP